jgi:F-type H+-transporting ATPase subunit delta
VRRLPHALVSRYARALFFDAKQVNALEKVGEDLRALADTWREHPELAQLIGNPGLSRDKVQAILDAVCAKLQSHVLTHSFLRVLHDKDRLLMVEDVSAQFDSLWRDHLGQIEVAVTTALPLTEPVKQAVTDHLARRSGKTPLVKWLCDPTLLGGVVIRWPDRVFDGSLARKLTNLKMTMAEAIPLTTGH